MRTHGPCFVQTDSTGKKYVSLFDGQSSAPYASYVERPDGTIEQEFKDGVGRGTTAPEGLYPRKET